MMPARYIMIGGFLGAGKTTAVLGLARHLAARGHRVGLITNDQSVGLVDTTMLAAHGFEVEEITGGCFCCRFNSLVEAADRLAAGEPPDVFIAEPVGSCTDLRASVSYPLRRLYGDRFRIAPLSVLVDPARALRVLGVEPGRSFSEKVLYVYGKQLEEAAIIVINKCDVTEPSRIRALREALEQRYPAATVLEASARTGAGLEQWFGLLAEDRPGADGDLEIDYQVYGEGERLLGWLNASVRLEGATFDGNRWLRDLSTRVRGELDAAGIEIAHLKMTLAPDDGRDLAVLNLVRTDGIAELSHELSDDLAAGELIVNLRAEADPDLLAAAAREALDDAAAASGLSVTIDHLESFRPGQPSPTHRFAPA